MSSDLEKLMMSMSMEEEEEDEPFNIPNLPEYYSSEKENSLSIIGRLLNPHRQKMKTFILAMPRIWKLEDSVRGVALSKEKFQFFFKNQQDLENILSRGPWFYKDWTIVIERWVQNPPHDYLHYIPVWVQIRNIPVNHYTLATVKALGKIIGKVLVVDFDATKPQCREYIRVKVRFDVSKPLRKSKLVNFPSCGPVTICYEFEKIHKRCFICQRLSHSREMCPLYLERLSEENVEKPEPRAVLKASVRKLGVLSKYQVAPEWKIREQRIGKFVEDLEDDPFDQKSLLGVGDLSVITKEDDKGKGRVFDVEPRGIVQLGTGKTGNDQRQLASTIQAGLGVRNFSRVSSYSLFEGEGVDFSLYSMPFQACSTGSSDSFHEATTSTRTVVKKKNPRRRPCKRERDLKLSEAQGQSK